MELVKVYLTEKEFWDNAKPCEIPISCIVKISPIMEMYDPSQNQQIHKESDIKKQFYILTSIDNKDYYCSKAEYIRFKDTHITTGEFLAPFIKSLRGNKR